MINTTLDLIGKKEMAEASVDSLFDTQDSLEVDDPFVEDKPEDSFDEIPSVEVTAEDISELESKLFLPKGLYVWEKAPRITPRYIEEDKNPNDVMQKIFAQTHNSNHDKGRMILNVSGMVVSIDGTKKGLFQFAFSPDYRSNKDDSNQPDMLSRTFGGLTLFYYEKNEQKPKNIPKDVNIMITDCNYSMYITLSKGGNANYLGKFQRM